MQRKNKNLKTLSEVQVVLLQLQTKQQSSIKDTQQYTDADKQPFETQNCINLTIAISLENIRTTSAFHRHVPHFTLSRDNKQHEKVITSRGQKSSSRAGIAYTQIYATVLKLARHSFR